MEAIFIPRLLKLPQQTETLIFDQTLTDLTTLTPVRGRMTVAHRRTFLEIIATAETIVTLTCDRCLQQYNYRLTLNTSELILLDANLDKEPLPLEREVPLEELEETLDPQGYFEPETWLYEQLCLTLPMQSVCDRQTCPGADIPNTEPMKPEIDSRWAKLANIKSQLSLNDN